MSIQDSIIAAAQRYGVDPALALAQAKAESNFNPNAQSGAGAIGVFQLMPATAADLGVDPYDVEQNIDGGVRYLAQMLAHFGGDTTLALAAYNAGPGNVAKYGGVPPFPETRNYIAKILAWIPSFTTIEGSPPTADASALDPSSGPQPPKTSDPV